MSGCRLVGQSFLSFTWEPARALPVLYSWLRQQGVRIQQRRLSSLAEADLSAMFRRDNHGFLTYQLQTTEEETQI